MSSFNQAIAVMLIAFFVYRSILLFKKVYYYELNKGYQHDTICYMTSPRGFTSYWPKDFFVISKWIVALLSGTLVGIIVAELINGDLNLALIHGFGIYMIDMTWITVYNYVCGVKIGEKGLIVGVDFIEWSDVELYAVNHNPKKSWNRFHKPGLRLLIREIGSLRPIWISVNDSNSGLVLSLIKEYMIQ